MQRWFISINFKNSCVGAYSLKLLNNNYNGPIVTIRKPSDNSYIKFKTNLNNDIITYDNDNIVDNILIEAILSSSGDVGYIYKLWDQSGNGNDLIQDDNTKQPIIDTTTKKIYFNGNSYLYRIPGLLSNGIKKYCYAVNFVSYTNSPSTICEHNNNTFMIYQRAGLCIDNTLCFKGELNDGITSYIINPFNNYSVVMNINNENPINGNNNLNILVNNAPILMHTDSGPGYYYLYLNNYGFTVGVKLSTLSTEYFSGLMESIIVFNNIISDNDMITLNNYQINNLT